MKRVPSLTAEPAALAAWRAEDPDGEGGTEAGKAWERFKGEARHAYTELVQALLDRQQGLCGYCEQRLTDDHGTLVFGDYQVEHVLAKSGGIGRSLDWTNLMLCCGGGTYKHSKDPTRHVSGAGGAVNESCGQAKGSLALGAGCDPRMLPWHEPIVTIALDGRMRARRDACERAGIDPEVLDQTIDERLKLNCERLRAHRQALAMDLVEWVTEVWKEALRESRLTEEESLPILVQFAGGRLRPDAHGHLGQFWSTTRHYLGELAEAWIRDNAKLLRFG